VLRGNVAITTINGETKNLRRQEWGQSTTADHRSFIWRVSCELPEVDDIRIRQLSGTFDIYYVRDDAATRRIHLDTPGAFVLGWETTNAPCLTHIGEAPPNVKYLVRGHSDALPFVQDESAHEFRAGQKAAAWERPDELFNIGWMLKWRGNTAPATLAVYENVYHEQVSFTFEDVPVP
jgi:hypothetical protein